MIAVFGVFYACLSSLVYFKKRRVTKPQNKHIKESLSVVFPCFGGYNEEEQFPIWDKYLNQIYDGPIDYVFVVETTQDAAYTHINNYLKSKNAYKPGEFATFAPGRRITLKVSGLSYHCAQKIRNQITGLRGQQTDYFLSMDDDMMVHEYVFQEMVASIRGKKAVGTGYTVEIPTTHSMASQMVASYRSTLLFGFTFENAGGVWGGCICIKREDYEFLEVEKVLANGGYSDDGLIQAAATKHGYKIIAPENSMYINRVEEGLFSKKYLDYVMRQYFVLKYYYSTRNKHFVNFQRWVLILAGLVFHFAFAGIFYDQFCCYSQGKFIEGLQKLVFVLFYLTVVGFFQNVEIRAFKNICERMTGQQIKDELTVWLSALSFHAHMMLGVYIIFYTLTKDRVKWRSATYTCRDGKVVAVERAGIESKQFQDSYNEYFSQTPGQTTKVAKNKNE